MPTSPASTPAYRKFIFSPDKHVGYINTAARRRTPIHDQGAIDAMLAFAADFKPDIWIEGGDSLDLSGISHWNASKPLDIESLDIEADIEEYVDKVLVPVNSLMARPGVEKYWMEGNHEAWLQAVKQAYPALRSATVLNLPKALNLKVSGWDWCEQGTQVNLSNHLGFVHGDNIGGGEAVAKKAVIDHEINIRFGHHHTHQIYTKHLPTDAKSTKTGVAVGCLCTRNPHFQRKRANKWVQGFNYGYLFADGTFSDYFPIVINGRFAAEGKVYKA